MTETTGRDCVTGRTRHEDSASAEMERLGGAYRAGSIVYRCPSCRDWHVGALDALGHLVKSRPLRRRATNQPTATSRNAQ